MYRKFLKRIVDIIVSFFGLFILFIPMIIIGFLIKLDSKGEVFFLQKRLGKNKKEFKIYKFRTMVPNAFAIGGTNTYDGDPRITRVGKILRKTSLDELPQLLNILKGEMSIIGPRPILPFEEYEVANPEAYSERYTVRPGLFCTVDLDLRASASREKQFEMDKEYCKNINFFLDFSVFFGVIKTVVTGANVYKTPKKKKCVE